jgi:hypothetical protein
VEIAVTASGLWMGGGVLNIELVPDGIATLFDEARFEIGFPPETADAESQQVGNGGLAGDFVS